MATLRQVLRVVHRLPRHSPLSKPRPLRTRVDVPIRCLSARNSVPATYTSQEDTIAAVVTGVQRAAVAIVRISGSEALTLSHRLFRPRATPAADWTPKTHRVYYGDAVNSEGRVLDEVRMDDGRVGCEETEDIVELHCHGGPVTVQRILAACLQNGARLARPGEFTLRAFLNGKMDLAKAESVEQLISAKTVKAADSALAGLKGGIGDTIQELREQTLDILGELEARLDFDEDMPELNIPDLLKQLETMQETVEASLKTALTGRLLREGLQIAIVGRPNVGKSSLMNAWCGVNKAIVTEIPGTTRDVVEADLSIQGVPVKLLDTAGIHEGSDVVEQLGIERAAATARGADVIVMVMDQSQGWTEGDAAVFQGLWGDGRQIRAPSILVANKQDKTEVPDRLPSLPLLASETFQSTVLLSALEKTGLSDLDSAILSALEQDSVAPSGVSWAVNERQSEALFRAHASLKGVVESIHSELPMDLWTIDLRETLLALGEVSGEDIKEEILDNVFRRFCIGK